MENYLGIGSSRAVPAVGPLPSSDGYLAEKFSRWGIKEDQETEENKSFLIFEDLKKRSLNTNKGSPLIYDNFPPDSAIISRFVPPEEAFGEGPAGITKSTSFDAYYSTASSIFVHKLYRLAVDNRFDNKYRRELCSMVMSLYNFFRLTSLHKAVDSAYQFLRTAEIIRESSINEQLIKLNRFKKTVEKYDFSWAQIAKANNQLDAQREYGVKKHLLTDEAWDLIIENEQKKQDAISAFPVVFRNYSNPL